MASGMVSRSEYMRVLNRAKTAETIAKRWQEGCERERRRADAFERALMALLDDRQAQKETP